MSREERAGRDAELAARTTVYRAAWVLPVASPPIPQGAVVVGADGRIAAVGPGAALVVAPGTRTVDLGAAALLPGLVNVHAHPELSLFRGALEDLRFRDWILRLVAVKRAGMRVGDFLTAARWTLVEALRAGTTTLAATESSAAGATALREAGMRGVVYREVFGPDPRQCGASMAELREAVETLRRREECDLVRIGVSPHAPYTVSDALFRAVTDYALAEGLPLAVHAEESAAERALVSAGEGDFAPGLRARGIDTPARARTTAELLDRLGVLRARPLLIHCVTLEADDMRRLADAGAAVAHCPVANARLGHGVAPYVEMRAAGIAVGLGTDSVGSNNRLDLLEEARIASVVHRARLACHDLLPADDLLRLCTLDGARVLGLDDRIGTLEPGKDADLCAVSLAGAHVRPVHDPAAAVVHAARGSDVILTVVRGRELMRDGRLLTLDEAALAAAAEDASVRVRSALQG